MDKNETGGTFSSWVTYAASYAWTLVSGDGLKTVYSEFRDAAGNVLNTLNDTVTLDTTSPSGATVDTSSPVCETVRFTVSNAGDGSGAGLHATPYSFDGGSNWQADNFIDRTGTSATQTANSIRVRDALGNITIVNTSAVTGTASSCNGTPNAPVLVSPTTGSYTSDNTPTLSATYSDADSGDVGTTNYRIASSASDCTSGTGLVATGTSDTTPDNNETTSWTPGSSIGNDGTYYWCAQNNDGTLTSAWTSMGNFILDTVAPDTSLTGSTPDSLTNSRSASFTFTGGTTYECKLDDGNYTTCTSPQSYSNLTDGSHTFMVRAIDLALNTDATSASYGWTVDATAPVITITNPDTSAAQSKSVSATVTSGDTLYKKEISAATACDATVSNFEAYAVSVFSTEAGNGQKVCYKATDTAGNVTYAASNTIAGIDTTSPTITVNNPGNTPATTKTITASATESATLNQKISATCDGSVTGFIAYSSITFSDEEDNGTTVCYRAVDAAGNVAYQLSAAIAGIDRQAPTGTLSIANGAAYASTTTVTLTNDVEGAVLMQYKNDGGTYSGWIAYLTSYDWTLTSGEGLKKVYGQFKDAAGNILTLWDEIT